MVEQILKRYFELAYNMFSEMLTLFCPIINSSVYLSTLYKLIIEHTEDKYTYILTVKKIEKIVLG